ncbi:hypothetical protein BSKO_11945 [Bryopsis sp. KO-2023]|nr:hypothetical protein BSKO_11945 [Bryopsis sp. KO-2023]
MSGIIPLDGFLGCGGLAGCGGRRDRDLHVCHGKNKPRNRRRPKNIPFRGGREKKPDPPSIEEWRAPPIPGTEEILRRACYDYTDEIEGRKNPEGPVWCLKQNSTEWLLDIEFENNEDVWKYIDSMEEEELSRQRTKYGLKYSHSSMGLKKSLMEFYALQALYQRQADEIMERRILKANRKAEIRGFRRARKAEAKVRQMKEKEVEPYAKKKKPEHFQTVDTGDWDSPIWQEHAATDEQPEVLIDEILNCHPKPEISEF